MMCDVWPASHNLFRVANMSPRFQPRHHFPAQNPKTVHVNCLIKLLALPTWSLTPDKNAWQLARSHITAQALANLLVNVCKIAACLLAAVQGPCNRGYQLLCTAPSGTNFSKKWREKLKDKAVELGEALRRSTSFEVHQSASPKSHSLKLVMR